MKILMIKFILCIISVLTFLSPYNLSADEKYVLNKSSFKAKGYNETILQIKEYGSYSIYVKSSQGTAVQLIDKFSGPGKVEGTPGKKDGRIDILLDEGFYKIKMYSHEKGKGELKLYVIPSREINIPKAPVLRYGQNIVKTLNDHEQLSYWIKAEKNKPVIFEAEGRALQTACIWKEGAWYTGDKPHFIISEPLPGRPVRNINFNLLLKPGYYKVTFYAGEPLKWSYDQKKYPFRLRFGIKNIARESRFIDTISSFGRNTYLVPNDANYFLLQLNEKPLKKEKVTLGLQNIRTGDSLFKFNNRGEITAKSRLPECKIERPYSRRGLFFLVTVTGKPGQKYILQTMLKKSYYQLSKIYTDDYWVSTIHSGFMNDSIDASGLVVEILRYSTRSKKAYAKTYAKDYIRVGKRQQWKRKFNFLGDLELYFEVLNDGKYKFKFEGIKPRVQVEPFFYSSYTRNYKTPPYKEGDRTDYLKKGIYIMRLRPSIYRTAKKGIITASIIKQGEDFKESRNPSLKGNLQFPKLRLNYDYNYRVYLNRQGSLVDYGLIVRNIPLDLDHALPVVLEPGEEIRSVIKVKEASQFKITSFNKTKYLFKIDGDKIKSDIHVQSLSRGTYDIYMKNEGRETDLFSLETVPVRLLPESEPEYLSTSIVKGFPKFEELLTDRKYFFDLEKNDTKIFLLNVEKAGIYRIESLGRLRTLGILRSRIIPNLFSKEANGFGRNFLLQTYLKEGIYQITVGSMGRSSGRIGLRASFKNIINGGELKQGQLKKENLKAGQAIMYRFNIPEKGQYRVQTIGLNKYYNCRLEDSEGYPVERPNIKTDLNRIFPEGEYRLVSMPAEVEGNRVTSLYKVSNQTGFNGKGPFAIELNITYQNIWNEKEDKNGERVPDMYKFNIPASLKADISFSDIMMAELKKENTVIAEIYPDKPFSSSLQPGDYTLSLFSKRKNNFQKYNLKVSTRELVHGLSYDIQAPAELDMSINENSTVELYSQGFYDVSAVLYSTNGEKIAYSDDSYNDWNFAISKYLPQGRYKLHVQPRGRRNVITTIYMNVLKEEQQDPITMPFDKKIDLKGVKNIFPIPQTSGLISVKINAGSFVGVSILCKENDRLVDCFSRKGKKINMDFYIPSNKKYLLAVWSLDHLDEEITLAVEKAEPIRLDIKKLASSKDIKKEDESILIKSSSKIPLSYYVECFDAQNGQNIDELYLGAVADETGLIALKKVYNNMITLIPGDFYLKINNNNINLRLVPVNLKNGYKNRISFRLNEQEPVFFNVRLEKKSPVLLFASGIVSQPLIGPVHGKSKNTWRLIDNIYVYNKISSYEQTGLNIFSSDKDDVISAVWNPGLTGASDTVTFWKKKLDLSSKGIITGFVNSSLDDSEAHHWKMKKGEKLIKITLDSDMAVYTWDSNDVIDIYHSLDHPEQYYIQTSEENITIARYGEGQGYYQVQVISARKRKKEKNNILVENIFTKPAVVNFVIPPGKKNEERFFYFQGTGEYTLINDRGQLIRESKNVIQLDSSAYRGKVECDSGFIKAWFSAEKLKLKKQWGYGPPRNSIKIKKSYSSVLSDKPLWCRIEVDKDSLINISSSKAYVSVLLKNDKFRSVDEVTGDFNNAYIAQKGAYLIGLRGLNSGTGYEGIYGTDMDSADRVVISSIHAVPMKKTMGTELLIGPDESKAFSFILDKKGDVGIGYKGDSDMLECTLYNDKNRVIKKGNVLFTTLEKGKYYVLYKIKDQNKVIRFQPIIVGIEQKGLDVPDDYINKFLKKHGYLSEE